MSTPRYEVYTINHATMTQYLRGEYGTLKQAMERVHEEVTPRHRSFLEGVILHAPTSKNIYSTRGGM